MSSKAPLEQALRSARAKAERTIKRIDEFQSAGQRIFVTSSFQTHSLPLLHIVSGCQPAIPVICLNTGYLFPETISFRDSLVARLGLELVDLRPNISKSEQRTMDGRLMFAADPEKCCYMNKVQPLEPFIHAYDVWISGVRAEQNTTRAGFAFEQLGPCGVTRFHPMLDWTAREVYAYRKEYALPSHPLEDSGYLSIGCMPCTMPYSAELDERAGRWSGQSKTECGLHTELASSDHTDGELE